MANYYYCYKVVRLQFLSIVLQQCDLTLFRKGHEVSNRLCKKSSSLGTVVLKLIPPLFSHDPPPSQLFFVQTPYHHAHTHTHQILKAFRLN